MKSKQQVRPVSNLNSNTQLRKANRQKLCLLAAIGGTAAMFPSLGRAQVPTPYLDINASSYNPVTGLLTPTFGPANIALSTQGGTVGIKENSTLNGTAALSFNGSTYFQIFNTANGANTPLLNGTDLTILAFFAPAPSNGNSTIVGGASTNGTSVGTGIQFRVNAGATTGTEDFLAGGKTDYGASASNVPVSTYSVVGITTPDGTGGQATYYLNGTNNGNPGTAIPAGQLGFDRIGARDGGENATGQIEEIQVYNSILSASTIATITSNFQAAYNTVSSTQLYYSGANSGAFDNTSGNFTLGGSATPVQFANGNSVIFQDIVQGSGTAITNTSVTIQNNGVAPSAVSFNNQTVGYTLSDNDGVNGITGGTGLTKNYAGSLTLNSPNSYTGATVLNGGLVLVNSSGAFGSTSGITINGSALNVSSGITISTPAASLSGGSLSLQANSTFNTNSGLAITGTGKFYPADGSTLGGSGTLTIGANVTGLITTAIANPYSTATISLPVALGANTLNSNIAQGTLALTGGLSGTGAVTINTGGLLSLSGSLSYTGATNLTAGALQINGPGASNLSGALNFSGSGNNSLFVTGGNINFSSGGRPGIAPGSGAQPGKLVVSGGSVNIAGSLQVGQDGYAELTVTNTGALTLPGNLTLSYPNGQGTLNMLGGSLTATSPIGGITLGNRGKTAVLNLDGGAFIASTVQGNYNGVVNFNGGTLQANASTPVLMTNVASAFIYGGGATINDGGAAVTVPQSLLAPTGLGVSGVTFGSVGTGYSYSPTVQVLGGTIATNGAPATATAIFNPATGQVTGVNITNPGNYTSTSGVTFNFSGGGLASTVSVPSSANFNSLANVGGGLTKTGAGILTLTGTNTYSGGTNVVSGTLQVSSPGLSVTVQNANFSNVGTGSYFYNPTGAGFNFNGQSGVTVAGSAFSSDGTPPVGNEFAFVQTAGNVSQGITFPSTGTYVLSFYTAQRIGNSQILSVSVGNTTFPSYQPGVSWSEQSFVFNASAGTSVLDFQGQAPVTGDNTAFVNNVTITQIGGGSLNAGSVPSTSQVNVATGAIFDVNNSVITVGSLNGPGSITLGTAGTAALTIGGDNSSTGNFSGVISGTGTLNKIGTGTQLLTGTNTFSGPTSISGGILALGAGTLLPFSTITVQSGGALGVQPGPAGITTVGNGSAGALTVLPGGGINLTDNALGKLKVVGPVGSTALTLGTVGATTPEVLTFEIGSTVGSIDQILVTGNVSALSLADITVIPLASDISIAPGSYTLITAGGGLGNSNFSLGANSTVQVGANGYALSLSSSTSTSEILTVSATGSVLPNAYYTGAIGSIFNASSGGATNFNTDATSGNNAFSTPTSVTNVFFTTSNPTPNNLDTTLAGPQAVNSLTFNANTTSPISISGSTLSIVAGSNNGNAIGNGINVSSGSGTVTINSNVSLVNSQTWTTNSSNPLVMNGSIGGVASLTQAGSGLVVLAGANTFTGGYTLNGGTLDLNSASALGSGPFIINVPTTIDNTSGAGVALGTNNTEAWNSDFTFNGTNNLNLGSGAVTINGTRTVTLNGSRLSAGGISDGGGGYSLITTGNGELRLLGASSYTGVTNVSGGSTLTFGGAANYSGGGMLLVATNSGQTATANFSSTGTEAFSNIQLGVLPGTSVLNLSSGTINNAAGLFAGSNGGSTIVNVTGGQLNSGTPAIGGQFGNFEFGNRGPAVLNQSGGSINVNGGEGLDVLLGTFNGDNNTVFNLTGGTFQTSGGGTVVGYRFIATINVSGTAQFTSPQIVLGAVGSSGGFNGFGYLNVSTGGIVTTSLLRQSGNGGVANFDGGTLQAQANTTSLIAASTGLTVNVLTGGANFDSNGNTAIIPANLTSPSGVTGGINKVGFGTIQLTGSNTYTGTTKVSYGTLQLAKGNGGLADFSFESPVVGSYTYAYQLGTTPWSFSGDGTNNGAIGSGIINKGNGGFILNNTPPDGNQAAFIQNDGFITQTVTLPQTTSYTLSFYTEQRENGGNLPAGTGQSLNIILNDPSNNQTTLGSVTPTATWAQTTYVFSATAGVNGFEFQGNPGGTDSTAYLDDVVLTGGGIAPISNSIPATSAVIIADNGTLDLNGSLQNIGSLTGSGLSNVTLEAGDLITGNDNTNTTFAGAISGTGLVFKVGTGIQTFSGASYYSGGTQVSGGTLVFASATAFPAFTPLTVTTGATAMAANHNASSGKNNLFVNGLSIAGATGAWTGTVDLSNNDMVVRGGTLATVTNQVAQGYGGGTWQGSGGILSSAAAANPSHLTALGVIQDSVDQNGGAALVTTFDGQTVGNTDILVKYTYYGDTDLNGKVDGTDYSRIDSSYGHEGFTNGVATTPISGWFNGDFNYDGVVDGSDYTLMDNTFNSQGAQISVQLASATAQIGGGSAVPEPASLSLLAIGAVGLLGRRRRSN